MKSFQKWAIWFLVTSLSLTGAGTALAQALVPQVYTGPTPPPISTSLGNALPVTGYYVEQVTVSGVPRTTKVYIAPGTPIRGYFTVISVPDGWNTEDFLVRSGWIDIANARREGLFVLEPNQSTRIWKSVAVESAYITAALNVMEARRFYSTHGINYIAGYGSGGTALQNYVANTPMSVISAVFINTSDLGNLGAIGAQQFIFDPSYTAVGMDPRFTSVPYSEVPVPVWFVNPNATNVANLLAYWKHANDVVIPGAQGAYGEVFSQKPDSTRLPTSYSEPVAKVALLERQVSYDDKQFTNLVYAFLSYYTRYDNTTIFGNMLGTRPDYAQLGVEIKNLIVTESDGQVWNREYMVYVPKNSKQVYPNGAPVVYVFAGGSQPDRLFFDITRWWEIADQYGFIVVVPCSQPSGPPYTPLETRWNYTNENLNVKADDFEFIKKLIPVVDAQYATDPGRRFAVGHSNGSMFDNGIAYRMPEYFTAISGNGATSNPIAGSATSVIPMYLSMAENDNGNPYLANATGLRNLVTYFLNRNGNLGTALNPESVQPGVGMLERTTLYRWYNDRNVPLFMYSITAARNHNVSVDTNWTAWEEWFSKWSKDSAGNLYYEGRLAQ